MFTLCCLNCFSSGGWGRLCLLLHSSGLSLMSGFRLQSHGSFVHVVAQTNSALLDDQRIAPTCCCVNPVWCIVFTLKQNVHLQTKV